jgi:hypothetical protein
MMSLMTVLIPLLLSSTEFVKLGNIQINLPTGGGAGGIANEEVVVKRDLNLGIVITENGIDIKSDLEAGMDKYRTGAKDGPAIIKKGQEHDFAALGRYLLELKKKVLWEILKSYGQNISGGATVEKLYESYSKINPEGLSLYGDNETVKIVAENKVKYQVIVSVMDAARTVTTPAGPVPLFPNVSLAGGLIQ